MAKQTTKGKGALGTGETWSFSNVRLGLGCTNKSKTCHFGEKNKQTFISFDGANLGQRQHKRVVWSIKSQMMSMLTEIVS